MTETCSYCGGPLSTHGGRIDYGLHGCHWDSGRCAFHLKAKLAASHQREDDLAAVLEKYAKVAGMSDSARAALAAYNAAKVSQPICTHAGVVSRDECPYSR